MPIWNPKAIDYSKGTDITDPETGKKYSQEQTQKLPPEIKKRLINKPRKIGCYVMTTEETRKILKERGII